MSLAARPSNIGTRFHNYLYDELGLNFIYKAFTTDDLAGAITAIRALGIRGCGVSMPYKEACIPFLDELDESARAIASVNTIVNDGGTLRAYNTDYLAIRDALLQRGAGAGPRPTEDAALSTDTDFALLGSGGMAKAALAALRDAGLTRGTVIARNAERGQALAAQYGFKWQAEIGELRPGLLVNATPIGMSGGPEADQLAFAEPVVSAAKAVLDVVALPPNTPLTELARANGKVVISGDEIIKRQALEQFVLYTGVRPTDEQVQRASEYSRAQT